jgi:hypothetical protein
MKAYTYSEARESLPRSSMARWSRWPCATQDAAPPRKVIDVDPNMVGTWIL